jgi:beta-galactosidase
VRFLNPSAGVKIRQNDVSFLEETKIYFQSLVPIIRPNLASNGGPIVLLQIENEYGFYGTDKLYM